MAQPEDAIDIAIHFPTSEASEWLEGATYRYDFYRTIDLLVGEFGALDVGSALAFAVAMARYRQTHPAREPQP